MQSFSEKIRSANLDLRRSTTRIVQVNLGKLCNQACSHCHVDASPFRTEIMTENTARRVSELIAKSPKIRTLDLTGGAPELNPNFRYLVRFARELGLEVIDRCNLTVLFEKGQEDTPCFLRENGVRIVASLPCYSQTNVDKQRGKGVFGQSIEALQMLNALGYGQPDSPLTLDLVYNPVGAMLPPDQKKLEAEYKARLRLDFGITFSNLFCITNMPIKRFRSDLERHKKLDDYMELLHASFNLHAAMGVMCLDLISIGWDGKLYDCDFNQMLDMPATHRTLWDLESFDKLGDAEIAFGNHCYACTAGAGSSCGGTLT